MKTLVALMVMGAMMPVMCMAQQPRNSLPAMSAEGNGVISMDVVVRGKSGPPVSGLNATDFLLMNNNVPQPILGVHEVKQQPAHVVIILDGVNIPYRLQELTREKMVGYLRSKEGKLAQPTTIGYFTDTGFQDVMKFTTDGNALADALQKLKLGFRTTPIQPSDEGDIVMMSFNRLQRVTEDLSRVPGYKAIVWVSPGWPLMGSIADRSTVHADLQKKIFDHVSSVLTEMRKTNTRLYSVNPVGAVQGAFDADAYKDFLGGLAKPQDAAVGNLGLQVLAVQSGGEALATGNDVGEMLAQTYEDTLDFYEVKFKPATDDAAYHKLNLRLDRKMDVFAMQGYYGQP